MSTPTKSLEFGVLLLPDYQLLDAAGPIDYINCHSKGYLGAFPGAFSDSLIAAAPAINWHYISVLGDLSPVKPSIGMEQFPTVTFDTCPPLDYLLVPGANPYEAFTPECIAFLQTQFKDMKALLTVCTGSMCIAQTGLLDGLRSATNKWAVRHFVGLGLFGAFTKVNWVTDERFVVDGKVWSGAGVTAGIDLAAEFCKVHFDGEIVELVKLMTEYTPNPARPDPYAHVLEGVQWK